MGFSSLLDYIHKMSCRYYELIYPKIIKICGLNMVLNRIQDEKVHEKKRYLLFLIELLSFPYVFNRIDLILGSIYPFFSYSFVLLLCLLAPLTFSNVTTIGFFISHVILLRFIFLRELYFILLSVGETSFLLILRLNPFRHCLCKN